MPEADWASTVRVQSEPLWEAELTARLGGASSEPSVWVTDLLDLRPAYYRRRFRVPPDRARRERQVAGRELHALIGSALAAPGYLEVRVRREGVVGQIDLFENEPTELKTTESLPDPASLPASRPSYLDQLGIYCALTDRDEGRLLVVEAIEGGVGRCQVFSVGYRSLPDVWAEVRTRATALREADRTDSPDGLPRCAWFNRGCEFQASRICSCTGEEPLPSSRLAENVARVALDPSRSQELESRLKSIAAAVGPVAVERFRDLLYPRRAYFERREPVPVSEEEPTATPTPARPDLYRSILDALESGAAGEVTRIPVPTGEPLERVPALGGRPYLLKVTRFPRHYTSDEILGRQPQYLLELGFRCSSVGQAEGWLILGYERAEHPRDRVRVYRVRFDPVETVAGLAADRAGGLERALATGEFEGLPACPRWMYESCPYRTRCGCGGSPLPAAGPG